MFQSKRKTTTNSEEPPQQIDYLGVCNNKIIDIISHSLFVPLNKKTLGFILDENDIRIYFFSELEGQCNAWNKNLFARISINGQVVNKIMWVYFTNGNPLSDKKNSSVQLTPDSSNRMFSIETFIKDKIQEQKEEKENLAPSIMRKRGL